MTAVWHGLIYGSTANGPVILDARTGQDKVTSPGADPSIVDAYVGIEVDPTGKEVLAYPADR